MTHARNKAQLFDYSTIAAQSSLEPSLVCLSATTKMLLLSVLDPIGWETRYIGSPVKATIERWRTDAMAELILGVCADEICELVTAAIEDCPDVQAAITALAGEQGWSAETGDQDNVLPVSVRAKNLLPTGYTCDADHRYGMAVGLVEAIHISTVEVFEAIELATNPGELAAEISDNVPIWSMVTVAADVALWMQETMVEAYNSSWSQAVADEISCELWCKMAETGSCYLSLDVVFDVYSDASFPATPSILDDALTWIEWLIALPLVEDVLIVKVAGLMGLLAIRFGGKFSNFSLGIRTFETTVALLADDTNSDHGILCDVCPDPDCDIELLLEGANDPEFSIGSITTTKANTGTHSAESISYPGDQEPTPFPGRALEFRVDLGCEFNSITYWCWVKHGNPNGGVSLNVEIYAPDDSLIDTINEFETGSREVWREETALIGVGGDYAIIRLSFSSETVGDQELYMDDITIA